MYLKKTIPFEKELNPQQLEVVQSGSGPVLVIAGAGSGKTRTITYRVAYLIERGIDPYRILLVTFTNKAAKEMLERVQNLLPHDTRKIWGGTFHHIANRILRVHATRIGFQPNYTILDQQDAYDLLNACLADSGYKKKDSMLPQGTVLSHIFSLARNTRLGLESILQQRYPFFLEFINELQLIQNKYTERKKKLNLMDFDDLLCFWLYLLEQDAVLRDFYAERFQHVLVDEYQDTNRLQADIIDLLCSVHQNIMVVGDDSQSIYSFRGADFSNIINFPKRYPQARVYKLEHNYRSSPEILYLANKSITCNVNQFYKILKPVRTKGIHPYIVSPRNVLSQAHFVADRIEEFTLKGISLDEIAVLYRAHYHSMELQMELTRRSIPFEVRSGIRFFEQAHIKDIASYLRILINPFDEVSWKRVLQLLPRIGKATAQKIWNYLSQVKNPLEVYKHNEPTSFIPSGAKTYWEGLCETFRILLQRGVETPPASLISAVFDGGYKEFMLTKYVDVASRSEDIEQFIAFASQYNSVGDFLSELALLTSVSSEDVPIKQQQRVTLSTVHQAKGLEWSVVFLIWVTEGRFPNPKNLSSKQEEEEERRLFYVAITRAKDYLFLCSPLWSQDRNQNTCASILTPSRFIKELPRNCFQRIDSFYEYEE